MATMSNMLNGLFFFLIKTTSYNGGRLNRSDYTVLTSLLYDCKWAM